MPPPLDTQLVAVMPPFLTTWTLEAVKPSLEAVKRNLETLWGDTGSGNWKDVTVVDVSEDKTSY